MIFTHFKLVGIGWKRPSHKLRAASQLSSTSRKEGARRKGYNPPSVGRQQRALPREKKRSREERKDGVVAEKNERDDLTAH